MQSLFLTILWVYSTVLLILLALLCGVSISWWFLWELPPLILQGPWASLLGQNPSYSSPLYSNATAVIREESRNCLTSEGKVASSNHFLSMLLVETVCLKSNLRKTDTSHRRKAEWNCRNRRGPREEPLLAGYLSKQADTEMCLRSWKVIFKLVK